MCRLGGCLPSYILAFSFMYPRLGGWLPPHMLPYAFIYAFLFSINEFNYELTRRSCSFLIPDSESLVLFPLLKCAHRQPHLFADRYAPACQPVLVVVVSGWAGRVCVCVCVCMCVAVCPSVGIIALNYVPRLRVAPTAVDVCSFIYLTPFACPLVGPSFPLWQGGSGVCVCVCVCFNDFLLFSLNFSSALIVNLTYSLTVSNT